MHKCVVYIKYMLSDEIVFCDDAIFDYLSTFFRKACVCSAPCLSLLMMEKLELDCAGLLLARLKLKQASGIKPVGVCFYSLVDKLPLISCRFIWISVSC